jgi:hypothetical protein
MLSSNSLNSCEAQVPIPLKQNNSASQDKEFTFQFLAEAKFQGFDAKDTQDLLYKWYLFKNET